MNVDEVIEGGNKKSPSKNFDKYEWAKIKQEQKEYAYTTIDKKAQEIATNPELFKTYLDVQARFDKYSVGNALLITEQMPNATQIRDYDAWKEAGNYINKNAKGIIILEPGNSYTKADGTTSISFNAKKVFDISQTNAPLPSSISSTAFISTGHWCKNAFNINLSS